MNDLKITDEQFENILRVSMSPEVKKTELRFAKKFGIRIMAMYMLMAAAGLYLITGAYIFAGSSRYVKADKLFLEIGNLYENSSFYVSFVTLWLSVLMYYFVDRLIQPSVYVSKLSVEVPNALKLSHFAVTYLNDGVKSSCSFNLLPAIVLWGVSFIILLVQMFRER